MRSSASIAGLVGLAAVCACSAGCGRKKPRAAGSDAGGAAGASDGSDVETSDATDVRDAEMTDATDAGDGAGIDGALLHVVPTIGCGIDPGQAGGTILPYTIETSGTKPA